jgi:hypothetical protein
MRKLFWFVIATMLVAVASCKKEISPDEVAAQAAKAYYEDLLHGKYDMFVDGHFQPDSIPESYREQLIANAKMFVQQQEEERRGIKQFSIVNAKTDTAHHVGTVYMVLTYGDSTSEEIAVPMVYHRGNWYLK